MENIELLKSIDSHLGSVCVGIFFINAALFGILGVLLARK